MSERAKALAAEFGKLTNLDADQLRRFRDSDLNEQYLKANSSKAQPGNEPLNDTIRLLETPVEQWRDVDDGFNEIQQAEENINFNTRTQAQIDSQGLGKNYLDDAQTMQVREAASIRWGFDPDDLIEW
jgi:hypothetical protein